METDRDTDLIRRDVVAGSVALSLTAGVAAALSRRASVGAGSAENAVTPASARGSALDLTDIAPASAVDDVASAGDRAPATPTAAPESSAAADPTTGTGPTSEELRLHVARRLTHGPTAELLAHIETIGVDAFIAEQLAPSSIDDAECDARLEPLCRLDDSAAAIAERENRLLLGERRGRALADLRAATSVRAVHSRRQLLEVVVGMWSDHFSIWGDFGDLRYEKVVDDRDVVRRHAMGRFVDLLLASAHSPAMLRYLDNHTSRAEHPNENYARELLELHTLGAGNHSEHDVRDTARVLTGWSIDDRRRFRFEPRHHDTGPATVAGWSTPGRAGPGAENDGIELLEHLARQPATARNVATRIARRFISDEPSAALVDQLSSVYLANDTAISPVLAAALSSAEFRESRGAKYRRPFEFAAATLRALGADLDAASLAEDRHLDHLLDRLGHRPFSWEAPDGCPDEATSWRSPNDVVGRWSLASLAAGGHVRGVSVDLAAHVGSLVDATVGEVVDRILRSVTPSGAVPTERQALVVASGRTEDDRADDLDHRSLSMMVAVALSGAEMQVR